MGGVGVGGLVEVDDEESVAAGLEVGVCLQRNDDVGLEPGVGLLWGAVVRVVVDVGDDVGERGERVIGEVDGELREGLDDLVRDLLIARNV